jgi:hypothetical protein
MKFSILIALALAAQLAHATGDHSKPHHNATIGAASTSTATADNKTNSAASSTSGDASSDNAVSTVSNDDSKFYVLPAPVFTPPLPAINSPCTNTSQEAVAVGWSAVSMARGGTSTDNCVAIEMYNAAVKSCRYATAGQIMDLLTVKVLAGFQAPKRAELLDLTPSECAALSKPVLEKKVDYQLLPTAVEVAAPAPVKKPKPKPKAAAATPECGTAQAAASQACKPAKKT